MKLLNCVLIDDNLLAIDRMEEMLKLTGHIHLSEKLLSPEEAILQIPQIQPDLVFLDVEMPGMSGFEVVKQVHRLNCFPAFVFVTGYDQYAIRAIKAGAFDYLLKPVDLDELNLCITRLVEKRTSHYFPGYENLSQREKEIMQLVTDGKTSREIGKILFISKHTVDTHRRNIKKKSRNGF